MTGERPKVMLGLGLDSQARGPQRAIKLGIAANLRRSGTPLGFV